jgi:hypothetical protein
MAQAKAKLSRAPARSKPARLVNHNRTQLGYAVSFLADAERRFPPKVFDRFVFELVNMYIDHNHEQRAFSKADQSKLERCAKSVRAIRRQEAKVPTIRRAA